MRTSESAQISKRTGRLFTQPERLSDEPEVARLDTLLMRVPHDSDVRRQDWHCEFWNTLVAAAHEHSLLGLTGLIKEASARCLTLEAWCR